MTEKNHSRLNSDRNHQSIRQALDSDRKHLSLILKLAPSLTMTRNIGHHYWNLHLDSTQWQETPDDHIGISHKYSKWRQTQHVFYYRCFFYAMVTCFDKQLCHLQTIQYITYIQKCSCRWKVSIKGVQRRQKLKLKIIKSFWAMLVVLLEDTVIKCFNTIYKMVIKCNIGIKFQYLSYF
jgi:hypothetical protein